MYALIRCMYTLIYIYIYIERERARERAREIVMYVELIGSCGTNKGVYNLCGCTASIRSNGINEGVLIICVDVRISWVVRF